MWPMCSELLAYGNALVTRIVRLEVNSKRLRNRNGSVAKSGRPSRGHYAIGSRAQVMSLTCSNLDWSNAFK